MKVDLLRRARKWFNSPDIPREHNRAHIRKWVAMIRLLGYNHFFTALQMDKYGRDCAQAATEALTAENKDLQILYETQDVIIHTLTAERNAAYKKVWQDAAQRCHEMYMEQEYQDKIDYCHDDYAGGIAEGMARCAKELAKKAKEQQ